MKSKLQRERFREKERLIFPQKSQLAGCLNMNGFLYKGEYE